VNYPRTAGYFMNRGHGAPFTDTATSPPNLPAITAAARHSVITLDVTPWYSPLTSGRPDVLLAFRRANPSLKLLAYQLFAWWYQPMTFDRSRDTTWAARWHEALRTTDGVDSGGWVKWDQPATEAALTKLLCDLAATRWWDGVFFDYFDVWRNAEAQRAVDRVVHALKQAGGPGFLVMGNGGDLRDTAGSFREGFPDKLSISTPENVRLWRSGRPHKPNDWLQSGTGHTDPANPATIQAAAYAVGTACLWDMLVSFGPDRSQTVPYHAWDFPAYHWQMGPATGPAYKATSSGIWMREFWGGTLEVDHTNRRAMFHAS
jgi:hypothetical protein